MGGWRWVAGAVAAVVVLASGSAAMGSNQPQIGPAPAWVRPAPEVPGAPAAEAGLPIVVLLTDLQFSFEADSWTEYHEARVRIQSAAGLQALGTLPFQWSPWSDTLSFHKLAILRNGQTLDLLPHDGVFTVLRREEGLSQFTLTGELTALIQPEGLQVGDVIDIVTSTRHAAPLMQGLPSAVAAGWDILPTERVRLEARWPSSLPIHWKATEDLPKLVEAHANGMTTLGFSLDHLRPVIPPAQAPARFQHRREIEFSAFQTWADVARVMAPLYVKAAQIDAGSPLMAEVRAIAARSSDPRVRAAEALHLAQSEVRYLAHAEAGGGYTPQTADETWRLRYGDCKAKTVLLLALLRELGVSAEPVLVSLGQGDALIRHLPAPLFDHVLVRVTVGGQVYWLDGARTDDRTLEELVVPPYGWVLPLGRPDAQLVHVEPTQPARPVTSEWIRYDATAGVAAPVQTDLRTVFRGDLGAALHQQLATVPSDQVNEALKTYWTAVHSAFTPVHVAASWDPKTGEETVTADGASQLTWSADGLEMQNVALGGKPDIARDPAARDPDAPYQVPFPYWVETDETVILPPGAHPAPTTAHAADFDKVIAGIAYHREGALAGNAFRVFASRKSVQTEISAAEARASVEPLTRLGEQTVYAPAGRLAQAAENAKALDSRPTTAEGHLRRARALMDQHRFSDAVVEYDAAIALDAGSQDAWGGRALAHAWLRDPATYLDADRADSLGKPSLYAADARGLMATGEKKYAEARGFFRKALAIAPSDAFAMEHMMFAASQAGDRLQALRELDTLIASHSELRLNASFFRAEIALDAHDETGALQELAAAPTDTPEDLVQRAKIYQRMKAPLLARADLDAAIRMQPTAEALITRASLADPAKPDAADMEAALALDPQNVDASLWKMNDLLRRPDYPEALKRMDQMLAAHHDYESSVLIARAHVYFKLNRPADMDADFARLHSGDVADVDDAELCHVEIITRWKPQVTVADCQRALARAPDAHRIRASLIGLLLELGRESEALRALDQLPLDTRDPRALNSACWELAIHGFALDRSLAYCDASLAQAPDAAATHDSRGLVLLRLGRNAEALAAYNRAISLDPREWPSHYGRAIAEARLGKTDESRQDRAAALAGRPGVAEDFARWGVR